jgi:hypothetical protein
MLRREVGAMGKLHSQLALFGSIDDEVVRRNDPRTTAIVESFLPGTTGYGQRGWFRELRTFVDRLAGTSVEFPSREEALLDLADPGGRRRPPVKPDDLPGDLVIRVDENAEDARPDAQGQNLFRFTPAEFEALHRHGMASEPDPPPPDKLTLSTLARAIYGGAVITRLEEPVAVEPASCPTVKLAFAGQDFVTIRCPGDPVPEDPLSRLLDLATPRYVGIDVMPTRGPNMRTRIARSRDLDRGLAGWKSFMGSMNFLSIEPRVANYPPPCVGKLRDIDGQCCAVVTTEIFDDNVQLDALEAIVDPRNWHQDLPTFFCAMEPRPENPGGWNQVLECVSTECAEYKLKTALKYWNAERGDHGIYINYDLADDRHGDTGLVEVDSGYIWITAAGDGIRIKTSKALKICGMSPTATAALACFSGWAQVGIDMLVNAALNPHQGAINFDPSTLPEGGTAVLHTSSAATTPTQSTPAEARLPDLPPGFRQDLIDDTATQLNLYIDATSRLTKNFFRRWQNGLSRTDMQKFGELFGKEMTGLALGSFDSVLGNFRPKPPQPTTTSTPDAGDETTRADPDFADRVADTARQIVDDTKVVTEAAADKIDGGAFSASDMTEAASRLTGVVVKGWMDLAGIILSTPGTESSSAAGISATSLNPVESAPDRPAPNPMTTSQPLRIPGNGLGATIQVLGELANRAFHRNLDVVKGLVDERVPAVASVVTDHMTNVMRRSADQAKTVVADAAKQFDAEGYGPDDWAKTVTKLGDVALINGIELVGTALIGPGRYETAPVVSDLFQVQDADPQMRHALSLVSPLILAGGTETIAEDCVTFDPTDGVLPAGTDTFRVRVKARGARSGMYLGAVWAIPLDASGVQITSDISEEVVPVIIGL